MWADKLFLNSLSYLLCPLISEISQLLLGDVFIPSSFLNDFYFVYIVLSGCYCFTFSAGKSLRLLFSGLETYTRKLVLRQSSVFLISIVLDTWQQGVSRCSYTGNGQGKDCLYVFWC